MKKLNITFLLTMLMSMVGLNASAHDIAVQNADGVTIYYNFINNNTELAVTYRGSYSYSYSNEYTGNVVIPESVTYNEKTYSVTSIGSFAFESCSGLTSVTIPNSVTSISDAFNGCFALKKVIAPDIAAWCGINFGDVWANPLCYAHHLYSDDNTEITELVIPDGVTSIGQYAFKDCSGLTSVTIPNSVKSIGNSAFSGCSGLTSVTIGSGVKSIGYEAFYECSGLTSVTIPNSVTIIGSHAFSYCSGLASVTIGSGVTSIGYEAFSYCSGLASVTIPNSVTSIGENAFRNCSGLTSVTIGTGVTSIVSDAFNGCFALKKVIAPDIAAWCGINFGIPRANPLFYAHHLYSDDNTEITELVIPDGVTSIGASAFSGCSGLTSVTIPNSVTSIGYNAFSGCTGLSSVTIPNSVTSIGSYAFYGCSGLTSVTIPNSVTSIGESAFSGCSKLASVTFHCNNVDTWFSGLSSIKEVWIEKEVTSIAQQSFAGCSGLKSVYNNAEDAFIIVKNTFATYSSATLYVPTGMKATYEETPWWLNFNKIEEYDFPTGITIPQQSKDVKVVDAYQINGLKIGSMQKGLNILRMSDGTIRKVVK